jgi:hypothetical protein
MKLVGDLHLVGASHLFVGTPDFGEALVIIAGVERKAHFPAMDLATPATKTCRRGPRHAPLGRLLRHSLSGRNDGGISRRSLASLRVFWRGADAHSV